MTKIKKVAAEMRVRLELMQGNTDIDLYLSHDPLSSGNFLKYVDHGCYDEEVSLV